MQKRLTYENLVCYSLRAGCSRVKKGGEERVKKPAKKKARTTFNFELVCPHVDRKYYPVIG